MWVGSVSWADIAGGLNGAANPVAAPSQTSNHQQLRDAQQGGVYRARRTSWATQTGMGTKPAAKQGQSSHAARNVLCLARPPGPASTTRSCPAHLRQALQLHAPPDGHSASTPHHARPLERLAVPGAQACAGHPRQAAEGGGREAATCTAAATAAAVCCAAAEVPLLWTSPRHQLTLNLVSWTRQAVQAARCSGVAGKRGRAKETLLSKQPRGGQAKRICLFS